MMQQSVRLSRQHTAYPAVMYCPGDEVVVRTQDEILATLDQTGCLDGVPFMPEMLQYCGRRMKVYKSAHKTCDYVTGAGTLRHLPDCVHLGEARCDGASHSGCQARCLIFWKTAWLKGLEAAAQTSAKSEEPIAGQPRSAVHACTPQDLKNACQEKREDGKDPIWRCQATLLPSFTNPIGDWDIGHYIEDYRSGNVPSIWSMVGPLMFRVYDNLINLGIGLGAPLREFYNLLQRLRGGAPFPDLRGKVPLGSPTPALVLDLRPGELVRVKSYHEILETLDVSSRNRGMHFSKEMVPYCGKEFRVHARVDRLVDEKTGRLLTMKTPGIILDGVICAALYQKNLLFCPRATYPYWREIWLDRVNK
jgi:hypothetical protein